MLQTCAHLPDSRFEADPRFKRAALRIGSAPTPYRHLSPVEALWRHACRFELGRRTHSDNVFRLAAPYNSNKGTHVKRVLLLAMIALSLATGLSACLFVPVGGDEHHHDGGDHHEDHDHD